MVPYGEKSKETEEKLEWKENFIGRMHWNGVNVVVPLLGNSKMKLPTVAKSALHKAAREK